jgi:hypothetical protein
MPDQLPPPPVPPECDLRDFLFMPLDVVLLRDSSFSKRTTGDEFRAGVMLWCAAWHQVPAGSLPDDDSELSALAGYGFALKAWRKVKAGAMQKFEKCSDNRWYHPEICKKAKNSWNEKLRHKWLRECERIKKRNARKNEGEADILAPCFDEWLAQNSQNVPGDKPPLSPGQPPDVPGENALNIRENKYKGESSSLPPAAAAPAEHKKFRGSRLPENWQPNPDDVKYAKDRGLNVSRVAEDFRGYWLAKAKDNTKLDWSLTWQGWCRRESDKAGTKPENKVSASHDPWKTGMLVI